MYAGAGRQREEPAAAHYLAQQVHPAVRDLPGAAWDHAGWACRIWQDSYL